MERLAARPAPEELVALLERDAQAALGESSAPEMRRGRDRAA
jgi:hypothetical protein